MITGMIVGALNIMGDTPGKIFIKKYGGMGSLYLLKEMISDNH